VVVAPVGVLGAVVGLVAAVLVSRVCVETVRRGAFLRCFARVSGGGGGGAGAVVTSVVVGAVVVAVAVVSVTAVVVVSVESSGVADAGALMPTAKPRAATAAPRPT
jgi:uncharacterized membrane protein